LSAGFIIACESTRSKTNNRRRLYYEASAWRGLQPWLNAARLPRWTTCCRIPP